MLSLDSTLVFGTRNRVRTSKIKNVVLQVTNQVRRSPSSPQPYPVQWKFLVLEQRPQEHTSNVQSTVSTGLTSLIKFELQALQYYLGGIHGHNLFFVKCVRRIKVQLLLKHQNPNGKSINQPQKEFINSINRIKRGHLNPLTLKSSQTLKVQVLYGNTGENLGISPFEQYLQNKTQDSRVTKTKTVSSLWVVRFGCGS